MRMREEYKAIVDAGFILQIDDPRLVTYYMMHPELSVADCRKWAAERVEAINDSILDIPPEKIRFHTCYSIDVGPRVHEMALKDIVDIMLKINAGAYSFEAANPRHEHEYHVFERVKLPAGKILIPGVISHTTNLVEHPELVAERIVRFAKLVGKENVIACTDCGLRPPSRCQSRLCKTLRAGGGRPIGEPRAMELSCRRAPHSGVIGSGQFV